MKEQLTALFWLTFRDPAEAALVILGRPVSSNEGWLVVALGTVLSTCLIFLAVGFFPALAPIFAALTQAPILYTSLMFANSALLCFLIYQGGRILGGRARLEEILLGLGWLQVFQVCVLALVLLLAVLSIDLAFWVMIGLAFYGFWINLQFVNVLHGFGSLAKALALIVVAVLVLQIAMSIVSSIVLTVFLGNT
ncbi:MAG: hypothetical protein GJ677_12505 [Rhodobacteraceae bacterium]|nr:hypothetical protein [Paracoccaceae bacterium]